MSGVWYSFATTIEYFLKDSKKIRKPQLKLLLRDSCKKQLLSVLLHELNIDDGCVYSAALVRY